MKTCPDCLERVEDDARLCIHCGHDFLAEPSALAGPEAFPLPPEPPPLGASPTPPTPHVPPPASGPHAYGAPPAAGPPGYAPPPAGPPVTGPPPPARGPRVPTPPTPPFAPAPPAYAPPTGATSYAQRATAPAYEPGRFGDRDLAGWWYRAGALMVDALVVGFALMAVVALLATAGADSDAVEGVTGVGILLGWPLMMATSMQVMKGQTPGKRVAGIRVLRLDGRPADFGVSVLRDTLFRLIPLVSFIDYLWPLWDERRQAVHDKVVSTVVVREPGSPRRGAALVGAVLVLFVAVVAVTEAGGLTDDYDRLERDSFVDRCVERGASESECSCRFDHVAANVPYDEYEAYDDEVEGDFETPTPVWLDRAVEACRR